MAGDLHEGFIRQRRNLIAISLLLTFILHGGVELPKVNMLGNELTFTDPQVLKKALIAAWVYFLYRYYVYFRDLNHQGHQNDYLGKLHSLVAAQILEKGKGLPDITPQVNIYHSYPDYWMGKIRLNRQNNTGELMESDEVRIDRWQLRICKLKAKIDTFIHTRYFTEYTLPFLIGALPLLEITYSKLTICCQLFR